MSRAKPIFYSNAAFSKLVANQFSQHHANFLTIYTKVLLANQGTLLNN